MIVLDTSALVIGLLDASSRGRGVRARLASSGAVRAPDLINCEMLSALRQVQRSGGITVAEHRRAVSGLGAVAVDRVPTLPFIERIVELADNVTPYDAAFIALAESLGCPLLTADRRLANAPGPRCDFEVV